jgi:anti-sigma regulatory factor (Ser/Thr protein kinase)
MSGCTYRKRFRIAEESVAEVRRQVGEVLRRWRLGGLVDSALLVVSELATNVVQHARGIGEFFEVTLRRRPGALVVEVEVADSYQWAMPVPVKPEPADTSGRGLLLVAALAEAWGVRPRVVGKTVWVRLAVPGGEAPS